MFTFIAAAALTAVNPAPVTTIIVDTREICYTGKFSDAQRDKADRRARVIARELRAEGKTVRIVKLDGRIQMASFATGPVVTVAGC